VLLIRKSAGSRLNNQLLCPVGERSCGNHIYIMNADIC
jgi:hypothetical protein